MSTVILLFLCCWDRLKNLAPLFQPIRSETILLHFVFPRLAYNRLYVFAGFASQKHYLRITFLVCITIKFLLNVTKFRAETAKLSHILLPARLHSSVGGASHWPREGHGFNFSNCVLHCEDHVFFLFSLYVLFFHFRPRDIPKGIFLLFLGKLCIHMHVYKTTSEINCSLE